MKKWWVFLTFFGLALVLTACLGQAIVGQTSSVAQSPAVQGKSPAWQTVARMQRGINIENWFGQIPLAPTRLSPDVVQIDRLSSAEIQRLRDLGLDHVRLPINLQNFAGPAPDYPLPPALFQKLNQVIAALNQAGLVVVLDHHGDELKGANDTQRISQLWRQVAQQLKSIPADRLVFEVFNEPTQIDVKIWKGIAQSALSAIRAVDPQRTVVIGSVLWNQVHTLASMGTFQDANVIYTFHFYEPMLFTHQGATWVEGMFKGQPQEEIAFPYDARRPLPPLSAQSQKIDWVKKEYTDYATYRGTPQAIDTSLQVAVQFSQQNQVPVWCGEFGVFKLYAPEADRVRWIELARSTMDQKGIAWAHWEYDRGFGLLPGKQTREGMTANLPALDPAVLRALNLKG